MANQRTLRPGGTNRREYQPERIPGGATPPRIPTAYEGNNIPTDFTIPPAGIADVDRALFNFFNRSLNLEVQVGNHTKKVPTIFAGGERFALTNSGRPIRDRAGAIIVPVVAIRRTSIIQGADPELAFGTDTGDIEIRRRLSPTDRRYQQLVNRFGLQNQDNVASDNNLQDLTPPGSQAKEGTLASRRDKGGWDLDTALDNPLGDNVVEILVIPTPDFFTCTYEITIWTNYVQELNQIIERMLGAYEVGSVYMARVESDKGYWYVAYFDDTWSSGDNFDDYTDKERLVKATITCKIPAFALVGQGAGEMIPIRSFVSAPKVDFEVCESNVQVEAFVNRMPLADVDDISYALNNVEEVGPDGRIESGQKGSGAVARRYLFNPFTTNNQSDPRFARVICVSKKGERVGKSFEALRLSRITKP